MAIKNYTSGGDIYMSLDEIQGEFARAGATKIMVDYESGKPTAVAAEAMAHDLRAYADWCVAHYEDVPPTIVNDLNAAAALIEQQEAKIAELEAKLPRWIPVEEMLPKKGEDGRD